MKVKRKPKLPLFHKNSSRIRAERISSQRKARHGTQGPAQPNIRRLGWRPVRCLLALVVASVFVPCHRVGATRRAPLNRSKCRSRAARRRRSTSPPRRCGSPARKTRSIVGYSYGRTAGARRWQREGRAVGTAVHDPPSPKATGDRHKIVAVQTGGWLSIVAVNEKTSIARVEHFCDVITTGDQRRTVPGAVDSGRHRSRCCER